MMHRDLQPASEATAVERRGTGGAPGPSTTLVEPLLDIESVAQLLSVKPSWIYEAVRSGRIPHLKIGRHVRFLRSDIEAWVVERRQ